MGLGSIVKIAVKAAPKLFNYGVRAVKAAPKLIFGTNSDLVGSAMKSAFKGGSGSIFTKAKSAIKAGGRALESGLTGKAFWKAAAKETIGLPKALGKGLVDGFKAGKGLGKVWSSVKGLGGTALKKMPLIGTLLTIGLEIPNIYEAGKDRGAGEALKETGKAACRLAGGAVGAAIGSAICPGIGSVIGWVAGEWLTGLVVGKSYSDKKEEAKEYLQEAGLTEEQIEAADNQGQDIIEAADKVKEEIEKADNTAQTTESTNSQQTTVTTDSQQTAETTNSQQTTGTTDSQQTTGTTAQQQATPRTTDPYGFGSILAMLNSNYYGYMPMMNMGYGMSNPFASTSNPYANPYLMQYPQLNYSA